MAYGSISKAKWPKGIAEKFYPVVFGDCLISCTDWSQEYFKTEAISTSITSKHPTETICRLARIDPLWYSQFAECSTKLIRRKKLPHVVWRRILADFHNTSGAPSAKSRDKQKDIPDISRAVKDFFKLSKIEYKTVAGMIVEVEKTNDVPLIARVRTGRKLVEAEERAVQQFLADLMHRGPRQVRWPLQATVNRAAVGKCRCVDDFETSRCVRITVIQVRIA